MTTLTIEYREMDAIEYWEPFSIKWPGHYVSMPRLAGMFFISQFTKEPVKDRDTYSVLTTKLAWLPDEGAEDGIPEWVRGKFLAFASAYEQAEKDAAASDRLQRINHHLNTIGWQVRSPDIDRDLSRLSPAIIIEDGVHEDLCMYLSTHHTSASYQLGWAVGDDRYGRPLQSWNPDHLFDINIKNQGESE